jgi:hypothetical protein
MFARWRARGEADFLTRGALKLAPDNDEVKKVLWKGSWPFLAWRVDQLGFSALRNAR